MEDIFVCRKVCNLFMVVVDFLLPVAFDFFVKETIGIKIKGVGDKAL